MNLTHLTLTPIETFVSPKRLLFLYAAEAISPFVISAGLSKSGYIYLDKVMLSYVSNTNNDEKEATYCKSACHYDVSTI